LIATPSKAAASGEADSGARAEDGQSIPGSAAPLEATGATGRPAAGAGVVPQSAADRRADLPVRRIQPPRHVVRTVACPTCNAAAGDPCQGRRGDRKANHFARVELACELRLGRRLELPDMAARSSATAGPVTERSEGNPEACVGVDRTAATDTIAPGRASSSPLDR
jgi:hypothetical protein